LKEIISIGPIHIYFFGMMIAIGMVIAGAFAIKQAEKRGINEDTILNVILLVVTSGIIGARLFYILFYNDQSITMGNQLRWHFSASSSSI